jgi:acetoin utilization protein AcuB
MADAQKPGMNEASAIERVGSRMRRAFIHAAPDDPLWQVAQLMQVARIRHVPVLEGARLVGVVSYRDLVEASGPLDARSLVERREHLRSISVSQVMRGSLQTTGVDDTLACAAEQMLRYKIGCLPVIEQTPSGSRVVGLITESDLLAAAYVPRTDPRTLEARAVDEPAVEAEGLPCPR